VENLAKGETHMRRNTLKARASIVGSGIAGLSAAAFLVRDSQVSWLVHKEK
jgi:myosin-crossreactive antigen